MNQNVKIVVKRNSFWVYDFHLPAKYDNYICTSYPLWKSICNVYDPVNRRYQCTLDLYDHKNGILKIPKGYGIEKLLTNLTNSSNIITYNLEYDNDYYTDYDLTRIRMKDGFEPRNDIQKDAVNWLMEHYIDHEETHHSSYLSLLTGGGKTFVAIYLLVKLNLPAIIISFNLSEQWKEKILEYTNAEENDIYMIRGSESIEKLLKSNKTYSFYIVSVSTLRQYMNNHEKDLTQLFKKMSIAIKVFDEAHTQYKMNSSIDVNSNVRYTLYLSATPGRSDYLDNRVYNNLFSEIPIYGTYTHTLDKHYKIKYIEYDTRPSQGIRRFCSTHKGFNAHNYYKFIKKADYLSFSILGMVKYFADKVLKPFPDHKVLCFIPSLKYMDFITKFFQNCQDINYKVGQYNSNVNKLEDREKVLEECNLIITTIAACSTGKDIPKLKAILSLTPFSSAIICRQLLGRLRPLKDGGDVYFFDFTDVGFAGQTYQQKARAKVLDIRAASVDKISIQLDEMILYLDKGEMIRHRQRMNL